MSTAREPSRSWLKSREVTMENTWRKVSNKCNCKVSLFTQPRLFSLLFHKNTKGRNTECILQLTLGNNFHNTAPIAEIPMIFFKWKIRKQRPKINQPTSASLKHHHVLTKFLKSNNRSLAPLTTLLGNCHHCVVADQAGYKGQGAGPKIFNDCRHECPGQSLLKCLPSWSILCFVAM